MSGLRRNYRSIEEFEREEIRPSLRIGFSIDDLEESAFEGELSFEMEAGDAPFEPDDDELDDADDGDERDADEEVDDEQPVAPLLDRLSQRSSPRRT
jgi:hypothetical protein